MLFSVIYSVDVPSGVSIRSFMPRRSLQRIMDCTEGDEEYEYDYLEGCWEKGKHRKLVGFLVRPHFEALIEDLGLCCTTACLRSGVKPTSSAGTATSTPWIWWRPW